MAESELHRVESIAANLTKSQRAFILNGTAPRGFALAGLRALGLAEYKPTSNPMYSRLSPTALGLEVRARLTHDGRIEHG